jgi:hypothetical protein
VLDMASTRIEVSERGGRDGKDQAFKGY